MSKIRRRSLTTGLVILAGALPAAAQADVAFNPANGIPPQPATTNAAPSSARLAQAAGQLQAVQPAAGVPASASIADSGFDWGDAAVGAGGTLILLGAGTAVAVTGRRRRAARPLAG